MSLKLGKGTGLALGQVQSVWPVCNTSLAGRTEFNTLLTFGFLTSLLESLWVLSRLVLSRSPCCIPLYSTATYTQERNKTHKNKLELVNLILPWATFYLYLSLRASTWSTIDFFDLYNQYFSSYPCHLDFLVRQISTLRVMWLFMAWLMSWTQIFTCTSPSHPVAQY
jgi:hypothetical protein